LITISHTNFFLLLIEVFNSDVTLIDVDKIAADEEPYFERGVVKASTLVVSIEKI